MLIFCTNWVILLLKSYSSNLVNDKSLNLNNIYFYIIYINLVYMNVASI